MSSSLATAEQAAPTDAAAKLDLIETRLRRLARVIKRLARASISDQQRFLTVDQAASYSGLSVASIRRLIAAGKLEGLHAIRGRVTLDRVQVDAYILSTGGRLRGGRGRARK